MFEITNYPNFIKLNHKNGSSIIFKLDHIQCTSDIYIINDSYYFNILPEGSFLDQLKIWKTYFHSKCIFVNSDTHLRIKIPFRYKKFILNCNPYEFIQKNTNISLVISLVGISFSSLQFKVLEIYK